MPPALSRTTAASTVRPSGANDGDFTVVRASLHSPGASIAGETQAVPVVVVPPAVALGPLPAPVVPPDGTPH